MKKQNLKIVNVKANSKDRAMMQRKAKRFVEGGNLSAWIRHAAKHFVLPRGIKLNAKGKLVKKSS